ncbi:hypothetical protein [Pseudoalteromonas sp.]|uniref:hypothetical protein n=1 Tax=Pseudoalteromonas sp. TaxID=53249 RepID=UPI003564F356
MKALYKFFTKSLLSSFFFASFYVLSAPDGLPDYLNWDTKQFTQKKPIWLCTGAGDPIKMSPDDLGACMDKVRTFQNQNHCKLVSQQNSSTSYSLSFRMIDHRFCPTHNVGAFYETQEETEVCPPEGYPRHRFTYHDTVNAVRYCLEERTDNCPNPTVDDMYIYGGTTNESYSFCFNNLNGTQCKITTDNTGGYMHPKKYATQEGSTCLDPIESDDPDAIEEPPEVEDSAPVESIEHQEADDSDKTIEIDALNQANDNLKIINDSINRNTDEVAERLNTIKDNIDNSNKYLSEITDNTGRLLGSNQDQTGLLTEIRDGIEKINSSSGASDCVPSDEIQCPPDGGNVNIDLTNVEEYTKGTMDALTVEPEQGFKDFVPTEDMTSFWTTEYEDGIAGVWEEKNQELQDTSMFTFLDQFVINGAGQSPSMSIDFSSLGFGGSVAFELDNRVYGFLSVFFLACAAFACRKIIFGG